MIEETKSRKGAWIWWLLFPPYAMYHFIRYSSLKWYVKVPVVLVLSLAIIMAIDLAVSPNRVEVAMAEKAINAYVKEELQGEIVLATERMGEGTSVTPEKIHPTVYYRVVTENSLFHMGLISDDGRELVVHHVEQLFPIRQGIKEFENRTKADVAIWLKENEVEVGVAKKLTEDDSVDSRQTILTEKGKYDFLYTNQHLYQVNDIKNNKVLMERGEAPQLPEEIATYMKKNEDRVGTLTRVLAYELEGGVERYYLLTSEGNFMTESHSDGTIDLKKRN